MPRIKPGAAGCEARVLSILLHGPRPTPPIYHDSLDHHDWFEIFKNWIRFAKPRYKRLFSELTTSLGGPSFNSYIHHTGIAEQNTVTIVSKMDYWWDKFESQRCQDDIMASNFPGRLGCRKLNERLCHDQREELKQSRLSQKLSVAKLYQMYGNTFFPKLSKDTF